MHDAFLCTTPAGSDSRCFSGLSSKQRRWRFSRAVCGCAERLWPHSSFFLFCLAPCPSGLPCLLCAQWMSLPSLKCWCVARFPSFGLARSEQRRCRAQLCATLQDLLLPALLGSAEVLSPHTEALEASLGWRSTGAAVLKRG